VVTEDAPPLDSAADTSDVACWHDAVHVTIALRPQLQQTQHIGIPRIKRKRASVQPCAPVVTAGQIEVRIDGWVRPHAMHKAVYVTLEAIHRVWPLLRRRQRQVLSLQRLFGLLAVNRELLLPLHRQPFQMVRLPTC